MVASKKPYTRKADAVSTRKHAIHKAPGYRLTDRERRILAAAWNGYVRRGLRISLRPFARMHALAAEAWRRECRRGAAGATVRSGNRWSCAEYDPGRAADSVREGSANMGAPMRLTVGMDIPFRHLVVERRRSPYDARMMICEAFPDRAVPCLRMFYNHAGADGNLLQGDGGVDWRTPSIAYVMKDADAQVVALFRSATDPLASQIDLVAGGVTVLEEVTEHATFQTDGALALPLSVSSDSLPKMTVAGLPPGLKFTAKRLLNRDGTVLAEANTVYAGVSEHDLPAITPLSEINKLTVSGLPAGLKYDAKLRRFAGVPTKAGFYTVTATVRSGRESSVSTFTVEVVAMPEWAVGTYVGFGICEFGNYTPLTNNLHWTFTVAANGRVSGKVVFDTGDDRLLTTTFSKPSLAAYNKWTEGYSCDVRILLKDGRDVVVDQIRRLCIAPSGVEGLYEKRIGSAWMHDRVDEETGEADWDGSILMAFQNAWKRKGFEGLPQFAEKKTTVSVTDAALPPDPSEPEVDPGTADLTLDIAQNGTVTATLTLRDGGRTRKLVTMGDLIVYTADYDEYGTLVYSAYVSLVFGNLGLLHARVEMEALKDGKVHAEGREIVSVDRF